MTQNGRPYPALGGEDAYFVLFTEDVMEWGQIAVMVGVLSSLLGAPLAAITMYLRTIRDQQSSTMLELANRIERIETSIRDLLQSTSEFEREYATKEEWVRESMLARQRLERLTELVTRIQAELESGQSMAAQLGQAAAAITRLADNWHMHGECSQK